MNATTKSRQDGMLPENYEPRGELTRAIWEAWLWLDRAERFYGGLYTLGDFARRLGTRAPTVWTWLSRATRPSYMMTLAIIAIYPPAEEVMRGRGLLDVRRGGRGRNGQHAFVAPLGAQTRDTAARMLDKRRADAKRFAARIKFDEIATRRERIAAMAEFRRAPKRVLVEQAPQSKRTDDHPMWHREAPQVGDLEFSLTAAPSRQTWSHDL